MTRALTAGALRDRLHGMRFLLILVSVAALAACGGDDDRAVVAGTTGEGRVNPATVAGAYEVWVCSSAECGPGTAMTGTRVGRLVLTADRSVAADDSTATFVGCISLGRLQQFDRSAAMTTVAWAPTQRPGELSFTGDRNSEGEYEFALNDLGGMLRGRGRWRRDGVFGEETPDFVVARRLDKVQATCPGPVSTTAFDAIAPLPARGAAPAAGVAPLVRGGTRPPVTKQP